MGNAAYVALSKMQQLHRANGTLRSSTAVVTPHNRASLFPDPSPTTHSITSINISLWNGSLFFSLLSLAWASGWSNYVNSAIKMISHSISAKKMLEIGSWFILRSYFISAFSHGTWVSLQLADQLVESKEAHRNAGLKHSPGPHVGRIWMDPFPRVCGSDIFLSMGILHQAGLSFMFKKPPPWGTGSS